MSHKMKIFKDRYAKFLEAEKWVRDNADRLNNDPVLYERVKKNLLEKCAAPMDEAFNELSEEERKHFVRVYAPVKPLVEV